MRAAPRSPRPPDSVTSAARPCPPLPRGRPAGRPGCRGPSRERRRGACWLWWGLAAAVAGRGGRGPAGDREGTPPPFPAPPPLFRRSLRRGRRRAYTGFLRYETAERTRRRPEYAEHQNTIDAFHAEAVRATGGKAS